VGVGWEGGLLARPRGRPADREPERAGRGGARSGTTSEPVAPPAARERVWGCQQSRRRPPEPTRGGAGPWCMQLVEQR